MSAARFLRRRRRGAAFLALCLCLQPVAACSEPGRRAAEPGGTGVVRTAQADRPRATLSPELLPAPAVFEATGTARWDGRRTLEGVRVAHPQAGAARGVRIYNVATGAAVDGAVFTRDPVLAGPSMLVSSDAARLLGMRPGEETTLRVVAVTTRQGK
jgi:hypothetical protein